MSKTQFPPVLFHKGELSQPGGRALAETVRSEIASPDRRIVAAVVNAVDDYGWTALHGAAYTGADDTVQFLVDRGAKLNVKDMYGQTPYSIAAGQIGAFIVDFQKKPFGPHPSTMNLLRKLGADPFFADVLKESEGAPVAITK